MPQREAPGWTCPLCTVVNDIKVYICAVCGARKQTSSRRARFNDTILAQQMQSEIISQEKPPILKNNTLPTKRSHNKKSNTSDLSLENFDETSNDGAAPFSPAISVQSKESKSSTASRKRKKDSSVKIKKIVKKR